MQGTDELITTTFNKETKTTIFRKERQKEGEKKIQVTLEDVMLDAGFTMVPNILIEKYRKIGLNDKQLLVVICLLKYAFGKKITYPSQKTIARVTGQTERNVRRMIRELKMMGYITVYKRYYKEEGKNPKRISNVYNLKGLLRKLKEVGGE